MIVLIAFFAHNSFEVVHFNVWQVNQTIQVAGTELFIKDFFLFYDAPETDHYGNVPVLDIQTYAYRLGLKTICFVFALGMFWQFQAFNILANDIPGRKYRRLPYIYLILVALFGYELIDFILCAGQTDWKMQAILTLSALSYVTLFIKK